jgi:hypothetical protein
MPFSQLLKSMSRKKGSVPPPVSPPTLAAKSPTAGGAYSLTDPPPPPPLTNGISHKDDKAGTPPGKQHKRQFKLTRAFTSGNLKMGKTKKKSKDTTKDDSEIGAPVHVVDAPKRRSMFGGSAEDGEDGWKLPGIGEISDVKLKSKKMSSPPSDTSLQGRELPPVPDDECSPSSDAFPHGRELPPVRASEPKGSANSSDKMNRELPPLPPPPEEGSPSLLNGGNDLSDTNPTYINTPSLTDTPANAGIGNIDPTYINTAQLKEGVTADVDEPLTNGFNTPGEVINSNSHLCNGASPVVVATDTEEAQKQASQVPELHPSTEETDIRPLPKTPEPNEEVIASSPGQQKDEPEGVVDDPTDVSREPPADEATKGDEQNEGNSSSSLAPSAQDEMHDYTIGEVITTYSYALPVRVRILQGYCSESTEVNISTEDLYDIHSVQHTRNVIFKDESGMTHRVSIDAPVKVGLIFNPKNDYDVSLDGYDYRNITEITTLPVLPKVIAATKSVNTGDEKNSVSEGEIFIVKQVQRSSMFKVKKGLKVYSLLTKSEKILLDDCCGQFSTKPSLVRMELSELLAGMADIYPLQCVIYPTTDDKSDFPGKWLGAKIVVYPMDLCNGFE